MSSEFQGLDIGFPPAYRNDAKLLVLGSLPGKRSIAQSQYYGHPRNLFWQILSSYIGLAADADYSDRLEAALNNKIALWDVMASAQRPGSLDSSIEKSSVQVNQIPDLIANLPYLNTIILNGGAAMRYFKQAGFDELCRSLGVAVEHLPSTSPAHAALSFEMKSVQWQQVIDKALFQDAKRISR
ncbi:MAG: hypothetical protein RL143_412 [Pseudomonadota bacterium]|jgi:hypoxanthine-DNA glycosylase